MSSTARSSVSQSRDDDRKEVRVKVIVRCRPMSDEEKRKDSVPIVNVNGQNQVKIATHGSQRKVQKAYTFDTAYGPETTQEELFDHSIRPIVDEVLKGYNCTVFAYGQTGTGKTFTMEGNRDAESDGLQSSSGVVARAVHQVFTHLQNSSTEEYNVRVSCIELYNEELTDLFAEEPEKKLRIFDDNTPRDGMKKGIVINNLEEKIVTGVKEVLTLLDGCQAKRRTAETLMNKNSSRSHTIFTITIHTKESTPDGEDLVKFGKLNLVDLAGSENVGKSGAVNERKKEAGMINTSLLTLGRVITALVENQPHIPYRESKLTRLLQDSLGGRTMTCVIATVGPFAGSIEETLSTLDYANRAKNIKNRPEVNQLMSKRTVIKEYTQEIKRLKEELQAARAKDGVFLPLMAHEEMQSRLSSQEQKIEELEANLEERLKEYASLLEMFHNKEVELNEETQAHGVTRTKLSKTRSHLQETSFRLKKTKLDLEDHQKVLVKKDEHETNLHFQATDLFGKSTEMSQDNSKLHEKIARTDDLSSSNRAALTQFQRSMQDNFRAFDDVFAETEASFSARSRVLRDVSEHMREAHEQRMGSIFRDVEKMVGSLLNGVSEGVKSVNDIVASSTASLSASTAEAKGHGEGAQKAVNEALRKMNEEVAQLIAGIRSRQEELRSVGASWKNGLQELSSSLTRSIESTREKNAQIISSLQGSLLEPMRRASEAFQAEQASLQELQEDMDREEEERKKMIISAMTEMIERSFGESKTSLKDKVTLRKRAAQTERKAAETAIEAGNRLFEESSALSIESSSQLQSIADNLSSAATSIEERVCANASSVVELGSAVEKKVEERADEAKKGLESSVASLDRVVSTAEEGVSLSHSSTNAELSSLYQKATETAQELGNGLSNALFGRAELEVDDSLRGTVQSFKTSQDNEIAQTEECVYSSIKTMQSIRNETEGSVQILGNSYRDYVPTGETPLRKNIELPSSVLSPQPRDRLLLAIRQGRDPSEEPKLEEFVVLSDDELERERDGLLGEAPSFEGGEGMEMAEEEEGERGTEMDDDDDVPFAVHLSRTVSSVSSSSSSLSTNANTNAKTPSRIPRLASASNLRGLNATETGKENSANANVPTTPRSRKASETAGRALRSLNPSLRSAQ